MRFDGPFAVWCYTIEHGRLLLRRTKSTEHPTRVDILFKDVGWMCMPTTFADVRIREASSGEADSLLSAGSLRTLGRRIYAVFGPNWEGYVLAGVVVWKEDDGEYNDPSLLLE